MLASVFRTVFVYVAVITAMRLMGKRQLGELQPAELVTTFLISNVASICIDEPDLPLAASIVPIFLLTALEILNSTLAWFCPRYARLLFGRPITVIVRGEIRQQALQELRITASDLMEALRGKEYFSPTELLWATVEPNGSISTAPVPQNGEAQKGRPRRGGPERTRYESKPICGDPVGSAGTDFMAGGAVREPHHGHPLQ